MNRPFTDQVRVAFNKGDRVQAQWLQATNACLAGMQPKTGAVGMQLVGTVRHIRADHPTTPTEIRVYVDPDPSDPYDGPKVDLECQCGHPHVELRPQWIQAVLPEVPDEKIDTSEVPELGTSFFSEAVLTGPGENLIQKLKESR